MPKTPSRAVQNRREYHGIYLTTSLQLDQHERAVAVLGEYYKPLDGKGGYTGSRWDTFDPSGTRSVTTHEFTVDDLLACSLLSAEIKGRSAIELLENRRTELSELLRAVGDDQEFASLALDSPAFDAMNQLYSELRGVGGVGRTRATKLLARKRPRMTPIIDKVIADSVMIGGSWWEPLHAALNAEGGELARYLEDVKSDALADHPELLESVPLVRVFDVLAWMDGTGKADALLGHA